MTRGHQKSFQKLHHDPASDDRMSANVKNASTVVACVARTLGEILQAAIDAKSRELGRRYSHRELGRDANVNSSYASRIIIA
jgi:hypothetical protein